MANTYKVLAQSAPVAATLTAAYTVPAATSAIVSSIVVCNNAITATSFKVSVAVAGAGDTAKQYLYTNVDIAGKDTFVFTGGLTLATTDVLRVYATLATVVFNVFGTEIT